MKSNVLISIIVLSFCGVIRVDAQFEDVKECLQNDQFISYVIDCFGAKFYSIIDAIRPTQRQEPETSYGGGSHVGRKLQSIDGSQMQSYYLKRLSTRKSREQAEVTRPSSMQSIVERARQMLVELTKEISQENGQEKYLDEVLDVLLKGGRMNPEVLGLLGPVLAELGRLRAGLDRMAGALNSDVEELEYDNAQEAIDELMRMKSCLDELDEEEFEDGFTWLRCLYSCSDLPLTSSCFIDNFNLIPACGRIPWMADLMMRLFVDYMKLQTCYFEVLSPNRSSTPLDLIEGRGVDGAGGIASSQVIEFRSYLPPGVHCFPVDAVANRRALIGDIVGLVFNTTAPCVVQIQMTTSNYIYDILPYVRYNGSRVSLSLGRPRCRNKTAINQISIGWHDNAVNASGIIVLERDNWNATFRVPVAARIDHKVEEDDEYTEVNFTMKMVVDGVILNSTKVLTRVYDRDVDSSICQSINDPHIVTFDNRYYNNFYQGYFTMYKHTSLPYEVQIIYQSCGPSAPSGESCNCGVAVRSGDDVFVVDRCRLKPEHCTGEDCRLLKVTLYVNGALTPGTRIFQEDGGLSYQIVLPHGTIVKVKSNGQELINVWIIPSPYDRENTVGLCGTFNVNREDDFTLPDGSVVNITDAEDTQPREFIEAWRVPPEKRIFIGVVSDESFRPGNYCRCSHYVLSGIECHCGYGELVETCDFSLGNEFTSENLTSLVRHSIRGSDPYLNQSTYEDKRDINETLIPDDPAFQEQEGNAAGEHCDSFLKCPGENLLNDCRREPRRKSCTDERNPTFHESIMNAHKGCIDDYKITHNNATVEWKMAATDAAKVGCLTWFQRSPKVIQNMVKRFENETCINECYGKGICEYGRCVCEDGFGGADCSLVLSSSSPGTPVLLTEDPLLCDKRHENCAFATIYGRNFTDDSSIVCTSTQIKVLDTESVSSSAKSSDVTVLFVNLNQVSCRLPFAASYRITVKHNGMVLSPPSTGKQYSSEITFMAYDSVCYTCDTSAETCVQKQDRSYCMVSGVCYENLQPYATDNCRYCNVSYSKDDLYDSQDPYCVQRRNEEAEKKAADKKNQDIRIAVGCSLSGIIIIISIIAFVLTKRKEKKMKSAEKSEIGSSIGDKITYTNPEFSPTEPVSQHDINDKGKPPSSASANNNTLSPYENVVVEVSPYYEEAPPADGSTSSGSTPASPPATRSPPDTIIVKHRDLTRVRETMEAEERHRTTSVSSGTNSNNIGGEPLSRRGSDAASIKSLGIGGGGPIGYGRVIASPRSRNNSTGDQMGIGAYGMPSSAIAAAQPQSAFVSEKL